MTDSIDRAAAIDALNRCTEIYLNNLPPTIYKTDAVEAVTALPSAQPEQRWIPCDEQMPEEKDAGMILKKLGTSKRSDYVLATVEVKNERMTATACTYDGAWNWKMKYAFPDYKVLAWMPLPEPYTERRNDEPD